MERQIKHKCGDQQASHASKTKHNTTIDTWHKTQIWPH